MIPETLAGLLVPVADLRTYRDNPRVGNIDVIAESLKVNGQYRPIVVRSGTNEVLAGNHTLLAARRLGWSEIAATFVDCTDDQAARIVLVDNRASDLATYDEDMLATLLASLDGEIAGTGYDANEVARLLADAANEPVALTDPDDAPAVDADTITAPGDVWELGPHRVWCGDATDTAGLLEVLGDERADCVWTDPPYGVSYVGKTKDALTIRNDGALDLDVILPGAYRTIAAASKPGAPVYVAHADTERIAFERHMRDAGLLVRQNLVWVKNTIVLGRSDYHYKHEPVLEGATAPEDPDEHEPVLYGFTGGGSGRLGRGGPRWFGDNKQSTVFAFPKPARNADHPTMKPVALVQAMLRNSCPARGLVLDVFGGSGSTLIAAHGLGLRSVLVELDPVYVDVICRRYQAHTGVIPVRDGLGVDFVGESD